MRQDASDAGSLIRLVAAGALALVVLLVFLSSV